MMKSEIRNLKSEASAVAQIGNLLYRRLIVCGASKNTGHSSQANPLPTASRRYSRVPLCVTTPYPSSHYFPGGVL